MACGENVFRKKEAGVTLILEREKKKDKNGSHRLSACRQAGQGGGNFSNSR